MSVADQGTLPSTPSCKRRASIESQASDSITRGTKKPRLSCHSSVGDPDTRVEANTEEQEGYWTKPIHQVLAIEEYYNREETQRSLKKFSKEYNAQQEQHSDSRGTQSLTTLITVRGNYKSRTKSYYVLLKKEDSI